MVANNQIALSSINSATPEAPLDEAVAVLDVGKTHAKLTLVGRSGAALVTRRRANARPLADGRAVLDADGIEAWALATLNTLARRAKVVAVVPVGHGAAAALTQGDRLAAPVLDYEVEPPAEIAAAYTRERDPFDATGSPRLPQGLNLGTQLFWQEQLYPDVWPQGAEALLWPQYWAWRLSGERAAERTSLGCHTDLWRPWAGDWSHLAERRGWRERLGPLRSARESLGGLRPDVAVATGLDPACRVICGLHDSNASLFAVRGLPELADRPFTLISTGTWFVTFQSGGAGGPLDPERDTLANVDVDGRPVASARFMGGRAYEIILEADLGSTPSLAAAAAIVARNVRTRPSLAPGGPLPRSRAGAIVGVPADGPECAALGSLHLALMSDIELDLVHAEGPIVIEGRFAEDPLFPAALAALRTDRPVFACANGGDAVALGAARLVWPELAPSAPLRRVAPAPLDLAAYARSWRRLDSAGASPLQSAHTRG